MERTLHQILDYLNEKRKGDFSGYRPSMLQDRIQQRCDGTHCRDIGDYFHHLKNNARELDLLCDALTINVSRFFRDPLIFEYIARRLLPILAHQKRNSRDPSLRIWSNGCAMGEEPYSVAILINELQEKSAFRLNTTIFATDIDQNVLKKAVKGTYPFESIKNIKYEFLTKYFSMGENEFRLKPKIKKQVSFSFYDILDKNSYAPPESVFGGFDMVLCRNVMIYFNEEYQEKICGKLHRSLTKDGYLILGESELISETHRKYFKKVNECCHIYQKIQ